MLFVPGDRPERFDKAAQTGVDSVVIDLEDAVLPPSKDDARQKVADWNKSRSCVIRINSCDTPWFDADAVMVKAAGVQAVMLPKAESVSALQRLRDAVGPDVAIFPLVETVKGVSEMRSLAGFPGVARLVFGSVDFALDSGIQDEAGWRSVQTEMVLASRLAGIEPPIDGTLLSWDDADFVRQSATQSRRMGFGGRLCIHPRQVTPVNEGMSPTKAEIDWAHRVLDAIANSSKGAVVVDGKLVDEPIRLMAERWLAE